MMKEFSPESGQVEASVEICEEIQRKVSGLLEEFEGMEKQDRVDLNSLQVGEKMAAVFRAGFLDNFARRTLLLVLSRNKEGDFKMKMSWRTLREGVTFSEQTKMPNLPVDFTSILLGEEQLPLPGDKIELSQITEGGVKWWGWQKQEWGKPELSMGYAEALLPADVVMSEVGSRIIYSMSRTGQLEKGRIVGPKPEQTYDLELPSLPFASQVLGRNLGNQAIFQVRRGF